MNFSLLVTPYDPISKSETIKFEEGPKLVGIHLSRGPTIYHVRVVALSVQAIFFDIFDPCGPYITFGVKLLITFVATHQLNILTKFGWNPMKFVEEEANCEKSCKSKNTTRNCALAKGAR